MNDLQPFRIVGTRAVFLSLEQVHKMTDAEIKDVAYFSNGLPILGTDGQRFFGRWPANAVLTLDSMFPGTEQAAYSMKIRKPRISIKPKPSRKEAFQAMLVAIWMWLSNLGRIPK